LRSGAGFLLLPAVAPGSQPDDALPLRRSGELLHQPDGELLHQQDVGLLLPPTGEPVQPRVFGPLLPRCVACLLRPVDESLVRRDDGPVLLRPGAEFPTPPRALPAPRASECRPQLGDLPPSSACVSIPLPRALTPLGRSGGDVLLQSAHELRLRCALFPSER